MEQNNLAHNQEYTHIVEQLRTRLAEVGKNGPPPAYVLDKEDMQQAQEQVCNTMDQIGYLEPSNAGLAPTPPGPVPPAAQQCRDAGGILGDDQLVCCLASCTVCGGKDCGSHPGGNMGCCRTRIRETDGKCPQVKHAPCVIQT